MIQANTYASRIFIFLIIIFYSGDLGSTTKGSEIIESSHRLSDVKVKFKGDISEKVKQCFLRVLSEYPLLHDYEIEVKQQRIKSSTMQAQPVFSLGGLFNGVKKYRIKLGKYVKDSDHIAIADLPEEVITGWFAHELGHLVDYESYSSGQMVWYGLKYVVSGAFRKRVEYEADYIALKSGFYDEIVAAKQFIIENNIGQEYVDKLKEFYLSIEDVQAYVEDESLFHDEDEL